MIKLLSTEGDYEPAGHTHMNTHTTHTDTLHTHAHKNTPPLYICIADTDSSSTEVCTSTQSGRNADMLSQTSFVWFIMVYNIYTSGMAYEAK